MNNLASPAVGHELLRQLIAQAGAALHGAGEHDEAEDGVGNGSIADQILDEGDEQAEQKLDVPGMHFFISRFRSDHGSLDGSAGDKFELDHPKSACRFIITASATDRTPQTRRNLARTLMTGLVPFRGTKISNRIDRRHAPRRQKSRPGASIAVSVGSRTGARFTPWAQASTVSAHS